MSAPQPAIQSPEEPIERERHLDELRLYCDGKIDRATALEIIRARDAARDAAARREIGRELWDYASILKEMGNANASDHAAAQAARLDPSLLKPMASA